jgi:membrane protein YqaA with SNARE-associated domain
MHGVAPNLNAHLDPSIQPASADVTLMEQSVHYLILFVASVAVDAIPVIGPPAWVIMVFMLVKFDLSPWIALAACVFGSCLGRYLQLLFLPKAAKTLMKRYKTDDLAFLGRKLQQRTLRCWGFVFLHAVTPLPTTALFTAAALAKVPAHKIMVPFFVAKTLSDGAMLLAGVYAVRHAQEVMSSWFSFRSLVGALLAVGLIALFFSVDWHLLLQKRKFALRLKFWR